MADSGKRQHNRPGPQPLLCPGHNAWRVEPARRVAFLVDGAAYFAAFRAAARQAQRSILIVGWDLHSQTRLVAGSPADGLPAELGMFLHAMVARRPTLAVHVLVWDFAMVFAPEREWIPEVRRKWRTHRRLQLRLDGHHPLGSSHHQKIVVIDDAVAFVGGLDLTQRRWDTPEHLPHDPRRIDPGGRPYSPFHDVQMLVDGSAAAAVGDLVRMRWREATGRKLPPPPPITADPWPQHVAPDLREVDVAIVRTQPAWDGQPEVREVETLYVDTVAAARRFIYLENQYFTAAAVGDALEQRLADPDGPEVVLVLPGTPEGWLHEATMGVLCARLLRRLRHADRYGRLRVYSPGPPDAAAGRVHIHAKVMVADDRLVRVGSANLNNRSMGLDTECDLAVAADGQPAAALAIAALRNRLLAEHLGTTPDRVATELDRTGSLIGAVEALRGEGRRTLVPFAGEVPDWLDALVPDAAILDPERPISGERLLQMLAPDEGGHTGKIETAKWALGLLVLLGLVAAWRWTPLSAWADAGAIAGWGERVRDSAWAPLAVLGAYVGGGVTMFPITLLLAATALTFSPPWALVYGVAGSLLAAVTTYAIGHWAGRATIRRLAGGHMHRLVHRLTRPGLVTVVILRLVPVAPFAIINLVAGAVRIRLREFTVGTVLGMLPGILAMTLFADQLRAFLNDPRWESFAGLAAVIVVTAFAGFWLVGRLRRRIPGARNGEEGPGGA